MKKFFLILVLILIVLALLLGGISFWTTTSQRRLNVNTLKLQPLTNQRIALTKTPRQLDLSLRTAVVIVQTGQHPGLQLTNVAANQYAISQHDGTLNLTQNQANAHQLEIGKSATITLTLPVGTNLNTLTIHQLNGTLKLNNLTTQQLMIHHHNGSTQANRLTVTGTGRLIKDNGSTTLTQLTSSGLKVAVNNGQAHLNGHRVASSHHSYTVAGQHPLTITSGSGQVKITQ